jgi:hypothetical protein
MKRYLRFALVLLAAAMHLAVPVATYAKPMPVGMQDDFCSAARGTSTSPFGRGHPQPSNDHHCAHAPCCAGGTPNSSALPPSIPVLLRVAHSAVRPLESMPIAAPFAVIIAAQPRGPPQSL